MLVLDGREDLRPAVRAAHPGEAVLWAAAGEEPSTAFRTRVRSGPVIHLEPLFVEEGELTPRGAGRTACFPGAWAHRPRVLPERSEPEGGWEKKGDHGQVDGSRGGGRWTCGLVSPVPKSTRF
jgi:hypothetical protein